MHRSVFRLTMVLVACGIATVGVIGCNFSAPASAGGISSGDTDSPTGDDGGTPASPDSEGLSDTTADGSDGSSPALGEGPSDGTATPPNQPPVAHAGETREVDEGRRVVLDGSRSSDPDGDHLTFSWWQVTGPEVDLLNDSSTKPSFIAPEVDDDTELSFTLTISDGEFTDQDTVIVNVVDLLDPASFGLVAAAGDDQEVPEGGLVVLDGSGSYGLGDSELTYEWFRATGPRVGLDNSAAAVARFDAPDVEVDTTLTFVLTVSQGAATAQDSVNIRVRNLLDPTAFECPVQFVVDPTEGESPLQVSIAAEPIDGTVLPEGTYEWLIDGIVVGDGEPVISRTFTEPGSHTVALLLTIAGATTPLACVSAPSGDQVVHVTVASSASPPGGPETPPSGCASDAECDDGLFCTGVRICLFGTCQDGTDPCPGEECDEAGQTCVACLADTDCDDGDACNGAELCQASVCQPGTTPDCDDGNACTNDSCDPVLGCLNTPIPGCGPCSSPADCDDGLFCNGVEVCLVGTCQAGTDPCPPEECDETGETCGPPSLSVSPQTLNFGSTATSLTFEVWNSGGGTLNYTISDDAGWLTVLPPDGDSSGEHDTITATVNRTGLSEDTYPAAITVTPNTGSAITVLVTMTVAASGTLPPPIIVASRISGMAPFAVFFEATDSTDSLGRSINSHGLLGNDILEYTWDFGAGSENDVGGRYFSGFNGAHVYETPGDYDVVLTVREASGQASLPLRVTAQTFAGTPYYVSADGNDTNNGTSPATAWKTYNKAFNAISSNSIVQPGDHVLFRRGDVFNYSWSSDLGSARNVLIAAYGTGNRPRIQYTGSSIDAVAIQGGSNAISIVDIIIDGNNAADLAYGSNNRLFLRMLFTNYYNIPIYADLMFIVDSVLTNAIKQNMFFSGSRLVLINNSIGPVAIEHNLYGSHIDRGVITGNEFHGAHWVGVRLSTQTGPTRNIVVSHNEIHGMATPITLASQTAGTNFGSGHNFLIEANYIYESSEGIKAQRDAYTDIIIRNNILRDNGYSLLFSTNTNPSGPSGGVKRLRFYGNTILTGSTEPAIQISTADHEDIEIFNNIIYGTSGNNSARAISIAGGMGEITSNNNLFYYPNQPSGQILSVGGLAGDLAWWRTQVGSPGGSSLIGDPSFVNTTPVRPEDFRLNPTGPAISPAIDAAEDLRLLYDDYEGNPRPLFGLMEQDIGALEQ